MKLDHLLRDQYFILQTDSKILSHMNTEHKDKVKRWKIAIQHFNFDVLHIEGKHNIEADTLSRLVPFPSIECILEYLYHLTQLRVLKNSLKSTKDECIYLLFTNSVRSPTLMPTH